MDRSQSKGRPRKDLLPWHLAPRRLRKGERITIWPVGQLERDEAWQSGCMAHGQRGLIL